VGLGIGIRVDQPVACLDLIAIRVVLLKRYGMLAAFLPQLIVAGIDHHPRQPAPQGIAAERIEPAKRRDQPFLDRVCRHIFIVQQAQRDAKQKVLITQDQLVECLEITALCGYDQRLLGDGGVLQTFHTYTIPPGCYKPVPEMSQFCNAANSWPPAAVP
jgi:hypothetical protein